MAQQSANNQPAPHPFCPGLTIEQLEERQRFICRHVAKPIPEPLAEFTDPQPAECVSTSKQCGILIGNKYHAANVQHLVQRGVTAVLNCASGGISRLPVDDLHDHNIQYSFTNVRQDHYAYPILHDAGTGQASDHFKVAARLYDKVVQQQGGKILFFCVAGQNRSAALALAVLLLFGYSLEDLLPHLAQARPFILENIGFQQQLVELEFLLVQHSHKVLQQRILQPDQDKDMAPPASREGVLQPPSQQPIATSRGGPALSISVPPAQQRIEIELLIPGLCTMEVMIPRECSVSAVKKILVQHANVHLLSFLGDSAATNTTVAKSWIVLASFGYDAMFDVPLEEEAISLRIQIERMRTMFNLQVTRNKTRRRSSSIVVSPTTPSSTTAATDNDDDEWLVQWNERCRFALVIFSVHRTVQDYKNENVVMEEPWTFVHEERPGAPATFLENTLMTSTHLRAWDFVSGKAFCSQNPIVFCYAGRDESNVGRIDRRAFMKVSTSANAPQQYHEPGQILSQSDDSKGDTSGYILGMGENAIVHRVPLKPTSSDSIFDAPRDHPDDNDKMQTEDVTMNSETGDDDKPSLLRSASSSSSLMDETVDDPLQHQEIWDAAVKRPYTLDKMLASLRSSSSEAGLAKRMRFANRLNSDGRIVEFYGLGVAFAANAYNLSEFKYELVLLSRYEQRFSTRTMKRFMEEYTTKIPTTPSPNRSPHVQDDEASEIERLQSNFTILSVKVLLVSLLNAFRDLTLLGVSSFDFNHMNNVLISRDFQSVRLIDIDGGSISSMSNKYGKLSGDNNHHPPLTKPGLDVDLNTLLPNVVLQLLVGKGRGSTFITNTRSEIWKAKTDDEAHRIVCRILKENFFADRLEQHGRSSDEYQKAQRHMQNVAQWFYLVLKKRPPWDGWTNDIYDAMRCIDHLPIA